MGPKGVAGVLPLEGSEQRLSRPLVVPAWCQLNQTRLTRPDATSQRATRSTRGSNHFHTSSDWTKRHRKKLGCLWEQKVVGSNPTAPRTLARAPALRLRQLAFAVVKPSAGSDISATRPHVPRLESDGQG